MGRAAVTAVLLVAAACSREAPLVSRAPGAPRSVVLRNVRVFDAPRATLADGLRDVLVRDGRIDAVGPPGLPARDVPEIDGRGGTLLPERPDVLKLAIDVGTGKVPRLARETIAAITAAGHAAGVRSIAHIGSSAEAIDAVRGGVDALAHAPWREELSAEAVRVIVAAHVPVVVTLAVWDLAGTPRTRASDFLPIEREVARAGLVAALLAPAPALDEATAAFLRAAAAAHDARRANVATLRAAGGPVLGGSEACNPGDLPGAGLHLELVKLVEAGLTPGEALRAATWENARFIGGDAADFGEIAVGKRADLLLVDGDPVDHIGDLGKIAQLVLDGAALTRRTHPE